MLVNGRNLPSNVLSVGKNERVNDTTGSEPEVQLSVDWMECVCVCVLCTLLLHINLP